jgi:CRISPR-associated protein Cmr1
MIELNYQLRFTTPVFLGNAEQNAQWRTPPIKALLRQWWRVAYAAEHGFAVRLDDMRHEEGLLFGHAWPENDHDKRGQKVSARKSEIRIRLSSWEAGKLTSWQGLEQGTVHHPETEKTGYKVGPHAYLGFGPLDGRGGTKLSKTNAAIQEGEFATLSLAVPSAHAAHIEQALTLMNHYGALGGRSRNGWGSFSLTPKENTPALGGEIPLREIKEALKLDWPHAIGKDTRPLIWQTAPHADWKALMKTLAIVKIGLRTQFVFPNERPDGEIHDRHWLSYPVTTHKVGGWDRQNLRLPNSLRFKVRPAPNDPKQVVGVIFHVPCKPPPAFGHDPKTLEAVWQRVHAFLDTSEQQLTRIKE